jgi:hypothetical protein
VVLQQPWSFSCGLNLVSQPGALLTNTSPHLHLFTRFQFSSFASYPTARADRKQQWWVAAWTEAPARAHARRNTKIVICPILSNRGSFRYCLVRKSTTIAKVTSTGRCTTLCRLEEVLRASSTPQGPRWQSFHTAKQKQQQNRGTFLKPPDMRPKG